MKILVPFFILFIIFSCNQNSDSKLSLPITIQIIPEDYDSSYSITWIDTLGHSENYSTSERPFELWCVIMAGLDTAGYYHGLSMPHHFTYFETTDSIIKVFFMKGPNVFSKKLNEDTIEVEYEIVHFKPIEINIKNDIRKELKFTLTEK